jgi:hypothetical protein
MVLQEGASVVVVPEGQVVPVKDDGSLTCTASRIPGARDFSSGLQEGALGQYNSWGYLVVSNTRTLLKGFMLACVIPPSARL